MDMVRCILRALGLIEGVGAMAMAASEKMVLVTAMLDKMLKEPEVTDLQLQLDAAESATKLRQFNMAGGARGMEAGGYGAGYGGAGYDMGQGGMGRGAAHKPHVVCFYCGYPGHYQNKCWYYINGLPSPAAPAMGMGRGGMGMGRGAGRGRGYGGPAYGAASGSGFQAFPQGGGQPFAGAQGLLAIEGPPAS
jgi:hypothetical protein